MFCLHVILQKREKRKLLEVIGDRSMFWVLCDENMLSFKSLSEAKHATKTVSDLIQRRLRFVVTIHTLLRARDNLRRVAPVPRHDGLVGVFYVLVSS